SDGSIQLLDAATGQPLAHFAVQLDPKKFSYAYSPPVFAPDGKLLASASIERRDNQSISVVHLWETETGKEVRQINGPVEGIRGFSPAFAPDFRSLAWTANDGTVRIHEMATGKELHKLGQPQVEGIPLGQPLFASDGKVLAWRTARGSFMVWDL